MLAHWLSDVAVSVAMGAALERALPRNRTPLGGRLFIGVAIRSTVHCLRVLVLDALLNDLQRVIPTLSTMSRSPLADLASALTPPSIGQFQKVSHEVELFSLPTIR